MQQKKSALEVDITDVWRGKTLESFLRQSLGLSRTRIRALKKIDGIWLDGHPVWVSHRLYGGEHLVLQIVTPNEQAHLQPEAIPISILYEDQDLIVLNKPAGMVVHPVKKHQSGTLANALMYHWRNNSDQASF
ncbi:MAG TPA: RluA family pseudouridine synthase, partial [Bacillota bacterium]|nr:RluA family pseudouridine synthase [Bacillota bacterium]